MRESEWRTCVDCASQVAIERVASMLGMEFVRCGKSLRHRDYDSLKINGNLWKRWSGRTGVLGKYVQGSTIQLVQEYAGIGFRDAVREILKIADPTLAASMEGGSTGRVPLHDRLSKVMAPPQEEERPAQQKQFVLPPGNRTAETVYRYLTQERAIMPEIVKRELASGRLYEDTRRNCVFVGWDDSGQPAFAAIRSTHPGNPFRMDYAGSIKACGWRVVPEKDTDTVLAFESPIEAMSYMSVVAGSGRDWKRSAYLSLGGVSGAALFNYLDSHAGTERVYLCLNNDAPGRKGARALADKIGRRAKTVFPGKDGQDWNDVLVERMRENRRPSRQEQMCR